MEMSGQIMNPDQDEAVASIYEILDAPTPSTSSAEAAAVVASYLLTLANLVKAEAERTVANYVVHHALLLHEERLRRHAADLVDGGGNYG